MKNQFHNRISTILSANKLNILQHSEHKKSDKIHQSRTHHQMVRRTLIMLLMTREHHHPKQGTKYCVKENNKHPTPAVVVRTEKSL